MKFIKRVKEKPLLYILILSLIIRIVYFFFNHPLWWDSHVYIGMGKYIFSGGKAGIWESFRPLVHPLILGAFWKLGLSPIILGKLVDLIFSLLAIYLTYLVGKEVFNKKVGLIGALIFSLSPLFLMLTGLVLTEPLALVFGLLGIYLFTREKIFLSGFFLSLAFLTKFPQGILIAAVFLAILFNKTNLIKKLKNLMILSMGFIIPVVPYLVFNYFSYPNIFEPFISGSWIVTTATWVYGSGATFYFTHFFLRNWIYLFFFGYIYYFFKENQWKDLRKLVIFLTPILVLLYFTFQVPRKETRYLIMALPFLAMLVSYTVIKIYYRLKTQPKPGLKPRAFVILCIVAAVIHLPTSLHFEEMPTFEQELLEIINEHNVKGPILTTDPAFVSFIDQPIIISAGMDFGPTIYSQQKGRYELLFINDCDLICPPKDGNCSNKREKFLKTISLENKEMFSKKFKKCTYKIYLSKNELPTID